MAQVTYARRAIQNIRIITDFYKARDPDLAVRVATLIADGIDRIAQQPLLGRPVLDDRALREKVVRFGQQSFLVLYEFRAIDNRVIIAAVRHEKQRDYPEEVS